MSGKPVWQYDPEAVAEQQSSEITQLGNVVSMFYLTMVRSGMDKKTARYLTGIWLESIVVGAMNRDGGS